MRTSASPSGHAGLRRLRPKHLAVLATALGALSFVPAAAQAADLHATTSTFSSVYSSAKSGDTVYLAAGSYGSFAGSAKSGLVTVEPESGASASMGINFNGATNVRVQGLTITSATVQGTSKNVAIADSNFTGPTVIRTDQMANANVVFDGDTFANLNPSGDYEGRITLPGDGPSTSGVVIENSLFTGGLADGIQNGSNGTKILNNEFSNIHQGDPNIAHTDALQLYGSSNTTVSGNYFHDVEDCIMAPDGTDHETITDNVCVTSGSQYGFTIGSDNGSVINHNTLPADGLRLYPGNANKASTGTTVTNNILPGGDTIQGSSLSIDYNLSSATTTGAHAIKGTPTYVGGSKPTTLDGYALAANSLGSDNASDGSDRGADPASTDTTTPPPVTTPDPPADTTAPDTTISSGPTGTITTTSASFAFTASESGSTFQCKLDAGSWATCTSPKAYSGLADGSHTVSVRATDAAGNVDASPATRTFAVDTTPAADTTAPNTSITSGPTGTITTASGSFAFTSTESGSTYACSLDGAAWTACTSPKSYSGLDDGSHTVSVRATDAAGNTDASPATRTFTVSVPPPADTTAPTTTIASGPAAVSSDTTPSFAFTASESGSTFQCKVDSGTWATCTSPKTLATMADGAHTFAVRATDAAGNTDGSPATRSFTVDTKAPNTTITDAPLLLTVGPAATISFTADDGAATFACSLDGGAWTACTSPDALTGLTLGSHTLAVRATDAAGNVETTPATAAWTAITAPVTVPDPPVTTPTPPVTTPPTTNPGGGSTSNPGDHKPSKPSKVNLHAPRKVTVNHSRFSLACGRACTVKVTGRIGHSVVALGRGTGDNVTLTDSGRRALAKAGSKGVSATVRAVAGQLSYESTSKLLLGK